MGRPPLGLTPTLVRLPKAMLQRIDALVGPNRRAQLIREAVERELARREAEAQGPAGGEAP
jgi:metal-responsive CopG/Arc/MetJ family transcriptional regulator